MAICPVFTERKNNRYKYIKPSYKTFGEIKKNSMKVCMFVILEIEFGIKLGGGGHLFNENNIAR